MLSLMRCSVCSYYGAIALVWHDEYGSSESASRVCMRMCRHCLDNFPDAAQPLLDGRACLGVRSSVLSAGEVFTRVSLPMNVLVAPHTLPALIHYHITAPLLGSLRCLRVSLLERKFPAEAFAIRIIDRTNAALLPLSEDLLYHVICFL
jgi:hypothetical protein